MALNKIKEWQLDLTETHRKINSLGKAVNFKGRVDSFNLLPTTGQDGDLWYVGSIDKENKEEYVWYDGKWELLGSSGALDIATTEEAKEGFDDSKVMTPLKTAQAIYENLGRVIQLGFDGTLTGNVLTFEPDIEGGYEIRNGYSYEIDLLFPAVVADGSLDENIEMVISNNGQTIKIVNALNDDVSSNITVGDMKQIMKYTTDIGFRWIFNARFVTSQSGEKVFVIPSTVSNVGDGGVAEAVENQNEENTTSPKVYTWVGTKAEYEEQKIATEHPDWLAYITDDYKDSDCFNQHNLLGGKDIEIVPESTGNYVINFTGSGASKNIGEVYYSQSSLATDNAGALPLFTGETIASANTIYPDFCKWLVRHSSELCCSESEYETALTTYGECPKYSFLSGSITAWDFSKTANPSALSGVNFQDGLTGYTKGTPFISISKGSYQNIYADKECTVYLSDSNGIFHLSTSGDGYYNLYQGVDNVFYECKFQKGDGEFVKTNLRLPKLSNYIKMANADEGITQSEAGLPNITGTLDGLGNLTPTGAFYLTGTTFTGPGSSSTRKEYGFDASLSNSIYGNSDTVTPSHTTLYPWVYAFSSAIPASTAQAAEFQNAISGKADNNLGNIPTNIDYVVEHITDELGNWATTWKSGRLRQGGISSGTSTNHIVTFLKPFANTQYTVVATIINNNSVSYVHSITETNFKIYQNVKHYWVAEGQGA